MELERPKTLREQALAALRSHLTSGALTPGEVYSATAIAREFQVSPGPVREAMLTLVNQGMMEVVPNKGFRVVALSPQDRREIAELRTLIEVPSMVRLADTPHVAERAAYFQRLVDELFAAAREDDLAAYLELDREFHLRLLALLENDRLTELIGTLRDQTRLFAVHLEAERGEMLTSAAEHQEILNALLAGDGPEVFVLMHEHLRHLEYADGRALTLGISARA